MENISVIGIGKLGLCFALSLEKAGYNVLGLDINQNYIDLINNKTLKSSEKDVEKYLESSKTFTATFDHSSLIFVIVATPSFENGRYDHSQIDQLIDRLSALQPPSQKKHLVICCTVMPGYTDSISERLSKLNYTVSYNPEFIAQGTIIRDQAQPDMVLIGEANSDVGNLIEQVYHRHTKNSPKICRMTPIEAEITKISLNCFLTTKIAYANMIGDIVVKSGGKPEVVLSAIGSDTRIGNKYLRYGYGYGGPCFPRDNRALSIYASDINMPAKISDATDNSNDLHLKYQIETFLLNNKSDSLTQLKNVTYKPESTLLTESQQLKFAVGIAKAGKAVEIYERKEVIEEIKKEYGSLFQYKEIEND